MNRIHLLALGISLCVGTAAADTPSQSFATGNKPMTMDVKAMDTNHDGMISKAEFAAYGEKVWKSISHGKRTVPVDTAALDFATGNMALNAQDMDSNHDGTISHDEFIAYTSSAFDKVKDPKGMLTVTDTTKYFATGNMKP